MKKINQKGEYKKRTRKEEKRGKDIIMMITLISFDKLSDKYIKQ